jgi:formyltetrahydrofolate deformylase
LRYSRIAESLRMTTATLLVKCTDRTGIVANLTNFVSEYNGNIVDLDQHSDEETQRFFMRLVWSMDGFSLNREEVPAALKILAKKFDDFGFTLSYSDQRQRVAILCSQTPHCLYDLLLRQKMGELEGDIVVVLSNHTDLKDVTEHFGLPFVHIPATREARAEAEALQQRVLEERRIDLVVLARYMQILTADFCVRWSGKILNIHHSFLPAFIGGRPHQQAFERGVKLIGATAHYVTEVLDDGPIIEQDVVRISHRDTVDELVQKGRDLEKVVLSRAVRWHIENRILLYGNKTVIFD